MITLTKHKLRISATIAFDAAIFRAKAEEDRPLGYSVGLGVYVHGHLRKRFGISNHEIRLLLGPLHVEIELDHLDSGRP